MGRRTGRRACAVATLSAALLTAGCTAAEPGPSPSPAVEPVVLGVMGSPTEQQILGELYRLAVARAGKMVALKVVAGLPSDPLSWIQENDVDVVPACTAEIFAAADPDGAEDLAEELAAEGDQRASRADAQDEVHASMVGVLPGGYSVTDRSTAVTCPHVNGSTLTDDGNLELPSGNTLPNNLTPILREKQFDRATRRALQDVTRAITDQELENLVAEVDGGADLVSTVSTWYESEMSRVAGGQHG